MSPLAGALVLCLAVSSQRSFVSTAPVNEGPNAGATPEDSTSAQDTSVRELESLKHSLGKQCKTLAMMKTQSAVYTDVNGQRESHADAQEEVKEDGKLLARFGQHMDSESSGGSGDKPSAKLRTDIEIPSKGIHKSVLQQLGPEYQALTENGNRRSADSESANGIDKYNSVSGSGVQFSPFDMAEYVFWTGDEKGVTLAIEEFLQEGLMTREEAISFLQEIKYNLDHLKNHYTQVGLNSNSWEHSKQNQDSQIKYPTYQGKNSIPERPELRSSFDLNQLRQEASKKSRDPMEMQQHQRPSEEQRKASVGDMDKAQDEDYDELLERLRVADFLYTEYSLEEVIYQLAKVMFTQSLTRGSAEAQQALQKFTKFLEMEAEQGHISRSLEKKVLDVLIASLSDTLTEHPELLAAARESLTPTSTNSDGQHFLRQILEISPEDKAAVRALYKDQEGRNVQMKEMKNHVPLGLGKYKNP